MTVKVDTSDLANAIKSYETKARSIPLSLLAIPVLTRVDDLIQSEGEGRWPGFRPSTLRRHPNRVGGKLLQSSGALAAMQTEFSSDEAVIFSPAAYGPFHADGTRKMQKRDYTDIDMDSTLVEIAVAIAQELIN